MNILNEYPKKVLWYTHSSYDDRTWYLNSLKIIHFCIGIWFHSKWKLNFLLQSHSHGHKCSTQLLVESHSPLEAHSKWNKVGEPQLKHSLSGLHSQPRWCTPSSASRPCAGKGDFLFFYIFFSCGTYGKTLIGVKAHPLCKRDCTSKNPNLSSLSFYFSFHSSLTTDLKGQSTSFFKRKDLWIEGYHSSKGQAYLSSIALSLSSVISFFVVYFIN